MRKKTANRLHKGRPKRFTRENLDYVRAALQAFDDFTHGSRAGHVWNLISIAQPRRFDIERRAYDVLRAGQNCNSRGLRIQHRARADQDLSGLMLLYEIFNNPGCARNREGNLHRGHTALGTRIRYTSGLIGALGSNHGDESGFNNSV